MLNNNDNTGWVTFSDCIKAVLGEEMVDQRHYARLLPICIRGYKKLYGEVLPGVKTELLEFDNQDIRLIKYPADYIYYTKVGMIILYGAAATPVIVTLSLNERLHKFTNAEIAEASCTCEETSDLTTTLNSLTSGYMPFAHTALFQNCIRNGQYVGEFYGGIAGMSARGSFREDQEEGRFVFSNDVPMNAVIALEYKSTGIDKGVNTRIPVIAEEAMIAWIKWRMRLNKNYNISEQRAAKQLWVEEYQLLKYKTHTPTMSEIIDVLERSGKLVK